MHSSLCLLPFNVMTAEQFSFLPFFRIIHTALFLRHNHTSVICDWWLDIKKSWESSKKIFLCFFEGLRRAKKFIFHAPNGKKSFFWSFFGRRKKKIEKSFIGWFKWIMKEEHCSVSLISWRALFGKRSLAQRKIKIFLYALDMIMPFCLLSQPFWVWLSNFFLFLLRLSRKLKGKKWKKSSSPSLFWLRNARTMKLKDFSSSLASKNYFPQPETFPRSRFPLRSEKKHSFCLPFVTRISVEKIQLDLPL